jgi:hypothetical protein
MALVTSKRKNKGEIAGTSEEGQGVPRISLRLGQWDESFLGRTIYFYIPLGVSHYRNRPPPKRRAATSTGAHHSRAKKKKTVPSFSR